MKKLLILIFVVILCSGCAPTVTQSPPDINESGGRVQFGSENHVAFGAVKTFPEVTKGDMMKWASQSTKDDVATVVIYYYIIEDSYWNESSDNDRDEIATEIMNKALKRDADSYNVNPERMIVIGNLSGMQGTHVMEAEYVGDTWVATLLDPPYDEENLRQFILFDESTQSKN